MTDTNVVVMSPATPVAARARRSGTAKRIRLRTLRDLQREMARVYRDVRGGAVESSDGSRLVFMLGQIGRVIEQIEQSTQGGGMTYEDYLREMHEKIIARQNDQKRLAKLAAQTTVLDESVK